MLAATLIIPQVLRLGKYETSNGVFAACNRHHSPTYEGWLEFMKWQLWDNVGVRKLSGPLAFRLTADGNYIINGRLTLAYLQAAGEATSSPNYKLLHRAHQTANGQIHLNIRAPTTSPPPPKKNQKVRKSNLMKHSPATLQQNHTYDGYSSEKHLKASSSHVP